MHTAKKESAVIIRRTRRRHASPWKVNMTLVPQNCAEDMPCRWVQWLGGCVQTGGEEIWLVRCGRGPGTLQDACLSHDLNGYRCWEEAGGLQASICDGFLKHKPCRWGYNATFRSVVRNRPVEISSTCKSTSLDCVSFAIRQKFAPLSLTFGKTKPFFFFSGFFQLSYSSHHTLIINICESCDLQLY